jgi:hypothetical protein
MTKEKMLKAQQLLTLIRITSNVIEKITTFMLEKNKNHERTLLKYDNHDYLTISEFNDGSGYNILLNRDFGNARLLTVIRDELIIQLSEFNKEFDEL